MLDQVRSTDPRRRRRSVHPPFRHILCALTGDEAADAIAVEQAIAVAGDDSQVVFAAAWYGAASAERAVSSQKRAREAVARGVMRGRDAGVACRFQLFHATRLGEALLRATAMHDLVVIAAPVQSRTAGIMLGADATLVLHRSNIPVLVARYRPLEDGVVVATRARRSDRIAVTAATHLAARLGADLTVVHVEERDSEERRPELRAELANARALLGRGLDYLKESGPVAHGIVSASADGGAGLVVVGSTGRLGLAAVGSVSERVAHLAPCSVLVMRGR